MFNVNLVCVTAKELYHVLHTDADLSVTVEGPVEAHNVRRITFILHDRQMGDISL